MHRWVGGAAFYTAGSAGRCRGNITTRCLRIASRSRCGSVDRPPASGLARWRYIRGGSDAMRCGCGFSLSKPRGCEPGGGFEMLAAAGRESASRPAAAASGGRVRKEEGSGDASAAAHWQGNIHSPLRLGSPCAPWWSRFRRSICSCASSWSAHNAKISSSFFSLHFGSWN